MKRTTLATGIIVPALLALLPACDDPFVCPASFTDCGGVCIDVAVDNDNCGACGTTCDSDQTCVDNSCRPNLVCNAPEENCGNLCVNTQTSPDHCGACNDPCPQPFSDCIAGACAAPLVAMRSTREDGVARDLYVLQDLTRGLTRINATTFVGPRVVDHAILPDGRLLLVAATTEDVFELWVSSPRGGGLTRVNGPLVAGGDVLPGLAFSADSNRVLYRADQDSDDVFELYEVALAAPGTSTRISGPLIEGGRVSRQFALSADGKRAVYIASQDSSTLDELYYVNLGGPLPTNPLKLSAGTDPVWDLAFLPDGNRVVYRQPSTADGTVRLNLVSVTAPGTGAPIRYAEDVNGHVASYRLSPDGSKLAFTGGVGTWDESLWYLDLNAVPPLDATKIADSGGKNYAGVREDIAWAPDSATVYYRRIDDQAFGFDRLYRVPVASPNNVQLLSSAGTTSADEATDFVVSGDGNRLVFRGGADGAEGGDLRPGTDEPNPPVSFAPTLLYIDLTAAAPVAQPISPPATAGRDGIGAYTITRDGTDVVFTADNDTANISDAYLIDLADAGTIVPVSPPLDATDDATDVSIITRF